MNIVVLCLTGLVIFLSVLFFFKNRIVAVMGWGLKILFPLLVVIALSGLFVPGVYHGLADLSLRQAGTLGSIRNFENSLNPLGESTGNTIDVIEDFFSGENRDETEEDSKGFLESRVYPGLVSTLGFVYRLLAIFISITGMIVLLYMSYSTGSMGELVELRGKYEKLEKRVGELERGVE